MDEKSDDTCETAVKKSERRSELALEPVWRVYEENEGGSCWRVTTPLSRHGGTVLYHYFFESQNLPKAAS